MGTVLAYATLILAVVVCFVATAFMIWDLWHILTIYVDGDE